MAEESPYLVLPGSNAFSTVKLAEKARHLGVQELRALHVHYINPARSLSDAELRILQSLLAYGEPANGSDALTLALVDALNRDGDTQDPTLSLFFVCPRAGTISPWSSKASDIARRALKGAVDRVEHGIVFAAKFAEGLDSTTIPPSTAALYDRMTQTITRSPPSLDGLFGEHERATLQTVAILEQGDSSRAALESANRELGLALDKEEMEYLIEAYTKQLKRDPSDVELFMFAQVNSEHCRHKQFNADWTIDGIKKDKTLFQMIRNTHELHPGQVISAYSDNAAVLHGFKASHWNPDYATGEFKQTNEIVPYLIKVETHNHPTAVSPYPGAATGSGGEIRDEGAVGRGSRPKAGLSGFTVSNLLIPGHEQPWELDVGKPTHIASALDIMIEAPIGSAAFNNEFGRPCTTGYFRTLTTEVPTGDKTTEIRGYHKPIMIAGGVGTVRPQHALKDANIVQPGAKLVVIGGPAMLIGLGGGAASSVQSGEGSVNLDFASVQRGNAEVERRAQQVINVCAGMDDANPILFIHDVGAGGLSNALPELVHDSDLGAIFELREIDNADKSMSPLQIWCCEAQERYVLAVSPENLELFKRICERFHCGYSVVGTATEERRLILTDRDSQEYPKPIDLPMSILFGRAPKLSRKIDSRKLRLPIFDSSLSTYLPETPRENLISEAVDRVLALPSVGSKSFLVTIGDRSVGGLTVRDQMVGPWQTPLADVSVTATSLMQGIKTGEAMAMGEKPTLALISPAASARMAVAESLMNIAAASISDRLSKVVLSANWMAAGSHPGEGAALYEAVEAIGMDLCPKLGICIPVGKDSMSMKMKWQEAGESKEVTAPVSCVITAFAPVLRIDLTWTPALQIPDDNSDTILLFVDLAAGKSRMGGSALAQVFGQVGNEAPDVEDALVIKDYFDAVEQLHESGIVLAYHDRSDGGLFTAVAEMAFAGRCGVDIAIDNVSPSSDDTDITEALFNEELGAVFQVRKKHEITFKSCFATCGPPPGMIKHIGTVSSSRKRQDVTFRYGMNVVYRNTRAALQQRWSATSFHIQKLRDNPACAEVEYENILDSDDPGLSYNLTFDPKENILPLTSRLSSMLSSKPRVAILSEDGTNGQFEMAFAFDVAGFSAVDVTMSDIQERRISLTSFVGLAACGGFSFGDVLGAGRGWAMNVLTDPAVKKEFEDFFARTDTFTLGVCNGCQFLSHLKEIIPGTENWPTFETNTSEQYEARVCMVEVIDPPPYPARPGWELSVFLHGMHGSKFPIVTAHGEGRATFPNDAARNPRSTPAAIDEQGLVAFKFLDNRLDPTEKYPFNPNGSPHGITGVRSLDGRVLAMMPHPERTILKEVRSWAPEAQEKEWGEFGPWIRMFKSARRWVG
ncbi:phosphoribosylformylglycinamidine synthase [Venturia nashicola]|uniref:Phosphoribosylformylglycinamidine synthase n=1 Tax=Venturia nashicola TaxID=86259 RepID=A0A4Z1P570_9PEZI|nr:phosphoribosylformylglycinamidine synthase [Venturia nashicola]